MKRREIIKYTAYITGATVSAPLMSALLVGCKSEVTSTEVATDLNFFNAKEFAFIKDLADLILPKTDSPSASEVGVPEMMDHMLGNVFTKEQSTSYKEGFTALFNHLGKIVDSSSADKTKAIMALENSKDNGLKTVRDAYLNFKQQTVAYYLSTEEVATKFLTYLPVPGKYEACITVEEAGGKAWAL